MGGFQRVYSDEQRQAVAQAVVARGITSPRTLSALAAAGELTLDGELVPAFALTEASAKRLADNARRDQERRVRDARAIAPADAVEEYRRRLSVLLDRQLSYLEELQSRRRYRDVKSSDLAGLARALQQLAVVPAPGDRSAGERPKREHRDKRHASGLADSLRASLAPGAIDDVYTSPVPADGSTPVLRDDSGESPVYDSAAERARAEDSEEPGEYVRARIAGLTAELSSVRPA